MNQSLTRVASHNFKLRAPRLSLMAAATTAAVLGFSTLAQASSHREAPFITTTPKVDGTDFYLFNSYEGVDASGNGGRSGFVTLIANYLPLQAAYGGPNYFQLDPSALYEIHIDNNGDAKEDLTFQFRFNNTLNNGGKGQTLNIGGQTVSTALAQGSGIVSALKDANLAVAEQYTVTLVRGDRRSGTPYAITNAANGSATFDKPVDNIGTKTIPDYAGYAAKHVYSVNIPGCGTPAKLFVGQRQDAFAVNLGTIFDNVNVPLSAIIDRKNIGAFPNTIDGDNVTTLALEVDKNCLKSSPGGDDVIGGWTSASLRQARLLNPTPPSGHQASEKPGGAWTQVSRLGMPLVNELIIGLKDKDKFNASVPSGDGQFATYVTNPTYPQVLANVLNGGVGAPTNFPRTDLVTAFLTGIPGVNQPKNVVGSEMLRLNTAIQPVPFAAQNRLGIVGSIRDGGSDFAGFPNGRRPKDDVVDVALVAVMGGLCIANGTTNAFGFGAACTPAAVPLGATSLEFHDGVDQAKVPLLPGFPYLNTPTPGAK
jgi:hypothetical protein